MRWSEGWQKRKSAGGSAASCATSSATSETTPDRVLTEHPIGCSVNTMTSTQNPYRINDRVEFHTPRSGWMDGIVIGIYPHRVMVSTYQGSFPVAPDSPNIRKAVR